MQPYRLSPWFQSISTEFIEPHNLNINEDGYIHLAVLLKNITNADEAGFKLRVNFYPDGLAHLSQEQMSK